MKPHRLKKNSVLFFSRIAPYKGVEYLIHAAKLVKRQIPDITVTIAGDGDFTKYRMMIGPDNSVIVLNRYIADNEVAELFQRASVIVLPYTDGSQTGIISIAATFKKPVIATDVGTFAKMVENRKTGLIVPPRDPNALAEAMISLLTNDKLRREMGENAYKMVTQKFSWDDIAQKTVKVYEEAIKIWQRDPPQKKQRNEIP